MKEKQKPLSFSLCAENIAYVESQFKLKHRSRSHWMDDLLTSLRCQRSEEKKATSVESRSAKAQRSSTKSTVSVSDSVSVSEKNKDIHQQIVDEYNKAFDGSLPIVSKLTQKRKSAINGCIAEMKGTSMDFSKIDEWIGLFDYIKSSDFLMGRKCDWSMSFDFVTNKNKLIKIIEGDYDNE